MARLAPVTLAQHRQGSGPPLLLIHGIGSQWQVWEPVLDLVSEERDVIAVDLPGFGASPPLPAGTEPTASTLAEAVAAHLDELGLDRPHVAGNSLGGWIALELARRGRAASVTALSPAGFWNEPERIYGHLFLRITRFGARTLLPAGPALTARPGGRVLLLAHVVAHPTRISPAEALQGLENLATSPGWDATLEALMGETFRDGSGIDVPVTIAWGDKDYLLPPWQAKRAARLIPHAKHIELPDCGHAPTWDAPELVAKTLIEGSAAS